MQTVVEIDRIEKVYGDRVLLRRLGNPEKRSGLFVPMSAVKKKEPKKVWWAEIINFGIESKANQDFGINVTDWVGIEPLGNHYASFTGDDGNEYIWVPDEHICLADQGSIRDYFQDHLDRTKKPMLSVLGDRLLLRELPQKESKIIKVHNSDERDAKISEVVDIGDIEGFKIGEKIVHVAEDNGSSSIIDIYDPNLIILREIDVIAKLS